MDFTLEHEAATLHNDMLAWEELHAKYEAEEREYAERMELERLHAEYGEYRDSEADDGVPESEMASFEEWYEARYLPDFA